jgi:hypothetical protein
VCVYIYISTYINIHVHTAQTECASTLKAFASNMLASNILGIYRFAYASARCVYI